MDTYTEFRWNGFEAVDGIRLVAGNICRLQSSVDIAEIETESQHSFRFSRRALYFIRYLNVRFAVVADSPDDALSAILQAVRNAAIPWASEPMFEPECRLYEATRGATDR